MLPIFSQDFLETNRLLDFVFQKRAKCCPFFFPRIFFRDKSIFRFGFQKRAKCCPFFSQEFFFGTN